jgi:hypothetical protein
MPSTEISYLSYEVDRGELTVTFVSGRRYRYYGVASDTYSRFSEAPSRADFFYSEIRDSYVYAELTLRSGTNRQR